MIEFILDRWIQYNVNSEVEQLKMISELLLQTIG
jgi:hypothetical protein